MSPQLARIVVVLIVMVVAVAVGLVLRKTRRPVHPDLTVGDVGTRPGVVLFTSTDCSNCKDAIAVLEGESIPFREVTHDLEPHRFETWNILAVPLTVVLDAEGDVVGMFAGVPGRRRLVRAVRRAEIRFP